MRCYFCEESPIGRWYHFENGRVVCDDCLLHLGLGELLDALEICCLDDFLLRFHIASRQNEAPYVKRTRRDDK